MRRSTIIEIIIFLYCVLFLYTGISKLTDLSVFKEQLSESPLFSRVVPLIAIAVPAMEFLIVLLLLIPRWRLKGFYAALILMVSFTIYIVVLLSIDDKLPCSCGGIISQLSWPQHLLVNTSFIIMAIAGIFLQRTFQKEYKGSWSSVIAAQKI